MKKKWLALFLFFALCCSFAACAAVPQGEGADISSGVNSVGNPVTDTGIHWSGTEQGTDEAPTEPAPESVDLMVLAQMDFSLKLFRATVESDPGENVMISPLSLSLILSLAANGAEGDTQTQILSATGGGDVNARNEFFKQYVEQISASEFRFPGDYDEGILKIANSAWYRSGVLQPDAKFLQTAKEYYGTEVNQSKFDPSAVGEVNQWVKENTLGQIENLVSEFPENLQLYLLNALGFEAVWTNQNLREPLPQGDFTTATGETQRVEWLSARGYSGYFEVAGGTGFFRPLKGNYEFVGILPPEGMTITEFVKALDSEDLLNAFSLRDGVVDSKIPKFSFEYNADLTEMLKGFGMTDAFDPQKADLSGMGEAIVPLYLGEIAQKTVIDVNEYGIKAAAVTEIPVGAIKPTDVKQITLDRPFVFLIVDDEDYLPIFMGVVNSVE